MLFLFCTGGKNEKKMQRGSQGGGWRRESVGAGAGGGAAGDGARDRRRDAGGMAGGVPAVLVVVVGAL